MLNNNSEQFPPVMSHHRPFDPTTSTTGMAQTNNASTDAAAVNSEAENSNHHLNPHQHHHHNININTTPVDPINPTTTSSSSSPADDDITTINNTNTNNTNTAITILHHFKNGMEEMMESGGVIEPLPTDVICGRGKMTSSHPANRRFRELVDFHKCAYQNSKRRDEKTRITCDLVDKLRSEGR